MTQNKLFLDMHAIQTLPPSNVNRDDNGSPKTAQYGGVRRARVSSQSWKRAIREYFNDAGRFENVGVRSLDVVRYVANKIMAIDDSYSEEDAIALADKTFNTAGIKTKDNQARALFFLGNTQAEEFAKAAIEGVDDKKALKAILQENPALDIALFGRMVADDASLNEDASAQVAHAISTHAVQTETDYYTALDDLRTDEQAGAANLGTQEFNSSTLYRYANVAIHEFAKQIDNDEALLSALKLFIKSFTNSMPTGKVNSYANQTLPSMLVVTIRQDRPINLVSAFEKPINGNGEGYVKESISAFENEYQTVQKFVEEPVLTLQIGSDVLSGEQGNLNALLDNFEAELSQLLANG